MTPTVANAAAWRASLPAEARRLVDECVRDLQRHPRMQGKSFGEQSALELVWRVMDYALTTPGVKWPQPIRDNGEPT